MENDVTEQQDTINADYQKAIVRQTLTKISPNSEKRKVVGVQVNGSGKLPCPDLGPGWYFERVMRQQGKSAGRFDTYYHSPGNVKIRSKLTLQRLVTMDLKNFDFRSGKFVQDRKTKFSDKKGHNDASLPPANLKINESSLKKPCVTFSNGKIKITGLLQSGYFARQTEKRPKKRRRKSSKKALETSVEEKNTVISAEELNARKFSKEEYSDSNEHSQNANSEKPHDMERDDCITRPGNSVVKMRPKYSHSNFLPCVTMHRQSGLSSFAGGIFKEQASSSKVLSPYELFKKEALTPASELMTKPDEVESLILCAWSYLSAENKTEFERIAASSGYQAPHPTPQNRNQLINMQHVPMEENLLATHDRNKLRDSGLQKQSGILGKCEGTYSVENSPSSKKSLIWQNGEIENVLTNHNTSESSGSGGEFPLDGLMDDCSSESNSFHSDADPSNSSSYSSCNSLPNTSTYNPSSITNSSMKYQCISNLKREPDIGSVAPSFFVQNYKNTCRPSPFSLEEKPDIKKSKCGKQSPPPPCKSENDFFNIKEEASYS